MTGSTPLTVGPVIRPGERPAMVDPSTHTATDSLGPGPHIGQVWRSRRSTERRRTVRVENVDESFVYARTLTLSNGEPPPRTTRNRVRLATWAREYTPVIDTEDGSS